MNPIACLYTHNRQLANNQDLASIVSVDAVVAGAWGWAAPLYALMLANEKESIRLANLRDALLPKLMSGKIDVSEVDLPTQPNNRLSN